MIIRLVTVLAVCLFVSESRVHADIVFGTGSSGATQNVGSYTQLDSMSATGHFLGTGADVLLVETNAPMEIPAAGAARVKALGTLFSSVVYTAAGRNWEVFELNVQNDRANGSFVLKAIDDGGTEWTSQPYTLGKGQNRVWAAAINNQSIARLTVLASGNLIQDVRQIRLTQAAAIPEPRSLAILAFAAAVGWNGHSRKKRPC
jgi:hypothetical protein